MLISADIAFPFRGPLPRWVLRRAEKAGWFDQLVNTRQLFDSCQPVPASCPAPLAVVAGGARPCGSALPLPLAGEGWGGGDAGAGGCGFPHPALRADLPRKRERLDATTFAES